MSKNTVYLITGANRGIGRALTAKYLSRANTTVIAAVRDPTHCTSQALSSLTTGSSSTLIISVIDSLLETSPAAAIAALPASITHIDTVIANAGVANFDRVIDISTADYRIQQDVNVIGPLLLFQATWQLLEKSAVPKFVVITSTMGSVSKGPGIGMPAGAYGASKAAVNYLVRKMHFEHPGLIALPLCPGFTQTDMGNGLAEKVGMEEPPVTLEVSVAGLVQEIDNATRTLDGRFASHSHIDLAW